MAQVGLERAQWQKGLLCVSIIRYIDTGAMYRGIAYAFKTRYPIDYQDKTRLADTMDAFLKDLQNLQIGFELMRPAESFLMERISLSI
jgi:cytidylate kinase